MRFETHPNILSLALYITCEMMCLFHLRILLTLAFLFQYPLFILQIISIACLVNAGLTSLVLLKPRVYRVAPQTLTMGALTIYILNNLKKLVSFFPKAFEASLSCFFNF